MTRDELLNFEDNVRIKFEAGLVHGPVHLSGGNEAQLIEIYKRINTSDWVFCTYRSHYHALLHGLPVDHVLDEIEAGRSMSLNSESHRFFTSAIVGGILPIATGVAAGIKRRGTTERVWCFVGDMAATLGIFHESTKYAMANSLPITFVVENNEYCTNTPTYDAWHACSMGPHEQQANIVRYRYKRTQPHYGSGKTRHL